MSEIRTETVPLVDGSALRLTVAEPVGPVRGGIVVLHEARGITDAVRGLVGGLAAEGWLTVAPHLYHRDAADELGEDDGDRIREQVGRLDGGEVMADTDTAFGWLAEHEVHRRPHGRARLRHRGDRRAAGGHRADARRRGVGGGRGQRVVGPRPAAVAGRRDGGPDLPVARSLRPRGRRRGRRRATRLRDASLAVETVTNIVVYRSSGHRFDADPDAAADAWQRTLNWFDSHLRYRVTSS